MTTDTPEGSSERSSKRTVMDDADAAEIPEGADAAVSGPGAMLRGARESLGYERQAIADSLNLATRIIEAIERDDFDRLPAPAFTRGYLRAYARMVHVDPEEAVARYRSRVHDDNPFLQTSSLAETRPARHFLQTHPGVALGAMIALVIGLAAFAAYYAWERSVDQQVRSGREAPASGVAAGLVDALPALERAPAEAPAVAAQRTEARGASARLEEIALYAVDRSQGAGGSDAESGGGPRRVAARGLEAPVDVSHKVSDDGRRTTIRAGGDDRLTLRFEGDCWVQIQDAESVDIYGDLNRAGERLEVHGRAPFRLLLGNASVAQLSYNDHPVSLKAHTRGDVARLVIGR